MPDIIATSRQDKMHMGVVIQLPGMGMENAGHADGIAQFGVIGGEGLRVSVAH